MYIDCSILDLRDRKLQRSHLNICALESIACRVSVMELTICEHSKGSIIIETGYV